MRCRKGNENWWWILQQKSKIKEADEGIKKKKKTSWATTWWKSSTVRSQVSVLYILLCCALLCEVLGCTVMYFSAAVGVKKRSTKIGPVPANEKTGNLRLDGCSFLFRVGSVTHPAHRSSVTIVYALTLQVDPPLALPCLTEPPSSHNMSRSGCTVRY